MLAYAICWRRECPDLFAQWELSKEFADTQAHPVYSAAGERYYAATHEWAEDCSFAVLYKTVPVAIVKCNIFGRNLCYFGQPISFVLRAGLDSRNEADVVSAIFSCFDQIAQNDNVASVVVRESGLPDTENFITIQCDRRSASVRILDTGHCDLSLGEEGLRRSLRKSFRSLVNWGHRNLQIEYFNKANPQDSLFDSYRKFHARVAGRVTRSDNSWRVMRSWVIESGGELSLAYLDNQLVGGTMVVDGDKSSLYASGVYDRSRFDKPLAHFPLYNSILRSMRRGMYDFDLGELPARGEVSDKEYNIGFFKRGFASHITSRRVWQWSA